MSGKLATGRIPNNHIDNRPPDNPEMSIRMKTEPVNRQYSMEHRTTADRSEEKSDSKQRKKREVQAITDQLRRKINTINQEISKLAHSNSDERVIVRVIQIVHNKLLSKIIDREKEMLVKQQANKWEKHAREINRKKQAKLKELKQREQALLKMKEQRDEMLKKVLMEEQKQRQLQEQTAKQFQQKQGSIRTIEDQSAEQQEPQMQTTVKHTTRESHHRLRTGHTDSILEPPPPNGYRNDFNAIKEHEKNYLEYIHKQWPKKQNISPELLNRDSFTLKNSRDEHERERMEKAKQTLERRQQYSQKILEKVHKQASHSPKQQDVDWRLRMDQEQHPAKYFKLQKLKKMSVREIFMLEHNAGVVEHEIVKEKGNEYLKELREKLKSMPHSKSSKERSLQEQESFSISKRFTNYLPSLHLDKLKKARDQKPKLQEVKEKAQSLQQEMLKKIQRYVDRRKHGIAYLQHGRYEQECDDSMIEAIRAKVAAAELL